MDWKKQTIVLFEDEVSFSMLGFVRADPKFLRRVVAREQAAFLKI